MTKIAKKTSLFIFISVFVLVVFRFILTTFVPLLDKTEARYGEISRLMYETSDWVVLQIDYGEVFWAKPPLSTWLSALSFEAFGVSEFSARLPSFLMGICILIIVGNMAKRSGVSFYLPCFILLTIPEFLIHMGVVSTDSALGFAVTLIMLSFWKAMSNKTRTFWDYLFFIGVGLGLLAKGPIVLILTAPPIFIWCMLEKERLKQVFSKLPWVIGILITCLIAIPWYVLAEERSPGFIDYFIVGEHFKRFFEPAWNGDLYGSPKSWPPGMIWIFLIAFAFPWIQIVMYSFWKNRKMIFKHKWVSYLILWLFWTPFFFTFSKNILHTYIVPVMVPIALLIVYWWDSYKRKGLILTVGSIFPAVAIVSFFGFMIMGDWAQHVNSDKYLLEKRSMDTAQVEIPVYYWERKFYSGQFYSQGKAVVVKDEDALDSVIKLKSKLFFVIRNKKKGEIPKVLMEKLSFMEANYKATIFSYDNTP